MTTGQRVSLNSVEAAAAEQRGGSDPAAASTYFVFEHVSQVGVRVCVWGGGVPRSAREEAAASVAPCGGVGGRCCRLTSVFLELTSICVF